MSGRPCIDTHVALPVWSDTNMTLTEENAQTTSIELASMASRRYNKILLHCGERQPAVAHAPYVSYHDSGSLAPVNSWLSCSLPIRCIDLLILCHLRIVSFSPSHCISEIRRPCMCIQLFESMFSTSWTIVLVLYLVM